MRPDIKIAIILSILSFFLMCGCLQEKSSPSSTTIPTQTSSSVKSTSTSSISSTTASSTALSSIPSTTSSSTITSIMSTATSTASTTSTSEPAAQTPYVKSSIDLPKGTYHSGETMEITVKITSSEEITGIQVRIYGIFAGGYRLNKTTSSDLKKGANVVSFKYTAPPCNTCAGIAAGDYAIVSEVSKDGKILARTVKNVSIMP